MINEGICLVISPLVALMKGCQFAEAQHQSALTGGIKSDEMIDLLDNCQFGNYLYLSLNVCSQTGLWRIKNLPISLITIDGPIVFHNGDMIFVQPI
jgi:ATP-dependent DNA helicase RecQ